ncbi:VOC family protein [Paenibacillus sp. NPDC056579]|uniref:VOC family protein n=1 Tax=Paenibacillus sp. NPDC056579 TaxID=3345871 RepID=UPI0036AB6A57
MTTAMQLVNELTAVACSADQTNEGLTLYCKNDGGYAVTPNKYKVPLTIEAVAKTDSTNIRLIFHQGQVIMNWENNLDELRWHDPATGKGIGIQGKGRIPVNEWVIMTWRIRKDYASLEINGEERFRTTGDFTALAGQIGIGAAHRSHVTVQSFRVTGETTDVGSSITGPPRLSWDGGFIYVPYEQHEVAIDWYTRHLGLGWNKKTWSGKQDPQSEVEKMSSLAFAERGLIHLKSFVSPSPLVHFRSDWGAKEARVRYTFCCPDISEAARYFSEHNIRTTGPYIDITGQESLDVFAFDGTRHTLISSNQPAMHADKRVTDYSHWRVAVPDLDRAAAWYHEILGLPIVHDAHAQGYIILDENLLLEQQPREVFQGIADGTANPYFRLRDMEEEHRRWKEQGVSVSDIVGTGFKSMHFYDPYGNRINFWSY